MAAVSAEKTVPTIKKIHSIETMNEEEEIVYEYSEEEYSEEDSEYQIEGETNSPLSDQFAVSECTMSPACTSLNKLSEGSLGKKSSKMVSNKKTKLSEYRIVNMKELMIEQNNLISEIAMILELDNSTCGILLRYFQWNKEKLFEQYCINPAETRKLAGVQYHQANASRQVTGGNDDTYDCLICCESYGVDMVFGVGCGHYFCNLCWKPYLEFKIEEGPCCISTSCPFHECNEIVPDWVFEKIVSPTSFSKYAKFLVRSYVDINKRVKWCPAPGCDNAVSGSGGCPMVQCSCGCGFCMRCGDENHLPVSCDHLALWREKCRNESETANWILANTKKCPKCSVRIEKNQGCNHMACRHCKFDFCWVCLGSWASHGANTGGYYKCNRYDAKEAVDDSDAARAKAELDRYLHYFQRYANHKAAGKFASMQREQTERRMIELQESSSGSSWIDVQFLKSATEILIVCRQVLKFTYVFAFYLPQGKEKNLFEYLQENLEKNTEHLTELSEMPLDKMDRSQVINFTRVTEKFLQNLLAGVEDGLTSSLGNE